MPGAYRARISFSLVHLVSFKSLLTCLPGAARMLKGQGQGQGVFPPARPWSPPLPSPPCSSLSGQRAVRGGTQCSQVRSLDFIPTTVLKPVALPLFCSPGHRGSERLSRLREATLHVIEGAGNSADSKPILVCLFLCCDPRGLLFLSASSPPSGRSSWLGEGWACGEGR